MSDGGTGTGWLRCEIASLQELKVRELDVSYCQLPTSIITSLLTRATTLEVNTRHPYSDALQVQQAMASPSAQCCLSKCGQ